MLSHNTIGIDCRLLRLAQRHAWRRSATGSLNKANDNRPNGRQIARDVYAMHQQDLDVYVAGVVLRRITFGWSGPVVYRRSQLHMTADFNNRVATGRL